MAEVEAKLSERAVGGEDQHEDLNLEKSAWPRRRGRRTVEGPEVAASKSGSPKGGDLRVGARGVSKLSAMEDRRRRCETRGGA